MTREWLTLTLGAGAVAVIAFVTGSAYLLVASWLLQCVAFAFYTPEEIR